MQASIDYIDAIQTDTGEVFRCGDLITVVRGEHKHTGRLDYVSNEYFSVDSSTTLKCSVMHFEYPYVEKIIKAEPQQNANQPIYFFKSDIVLSQSDANIVRTHIIEQMAEGVVLVPSYMSGPIIAPQNGNVPHIEFVRREDTTNDNN